MAAITAGMVAELRGKTFACGQGTGVVFGLGAGAQHGVVKALGLRPELELFGLQHEMAALVAVDPPFCGRPVAMMKNDAPLKNGRGRRGSCRRLPATCSTESPARHATWRRCLQHQPPPLRRLLSDSAQPLQFHACQGGGRQR